MATKTKAGKGNKPSETLKPTGDTFTAQRLGQVEELSHTLPFIYQALAKAYIYGNGDLNTDVIRSYLPGETLEVAHFCGLIAASETVISEDAIGPEEEAMIDHLCVRKQFKSEFFRLLEEPILMLTAMSDADEALRTNPESIRWKEPTPRQHLDTFLAKRKRWTKVWLVQTMTGVHNSIDQATDQFIKRLYKTPTEPIKHHARTFARLERLREVMATEWPEKFGHYKTATHLIWTPINTTD